MQCSWCTISCYDSVTMTQCDNRSVYHSSWLTFSVLGIPCDDALFNITMTQCDNRSVYHSSWLTFSVLGIPCDDALIDITMTQCGSLIYLAPRVERHVPSNPYRISSYTPPEPSGPKLDQLKDTRLGTFMNAFVDNIKKEMHTSMEKKPRK